VSRLSLAVAALAAAASQIPLPLPVAAQAPDEKVNMVIVYGQDECPQPKGNEITVCARKSESERYRIPEDLRGSESPQNDAWNNKVLSYEMVGKTGTLSCSPVGPGGFTGCAQQMINKAYAEKGDNPSVRFSDLIAAERERRLSTIDADAAATQARVEAEERQDEARRAGEPGSAPAPAPPAQPAPTPAGQ
jgi:hypothetical protein